MPAIWGGMYPDVDSVPGGLLGADFEIHDGRYRIEKIYTGENWNPTLRSPLAGPGIDIREGDLILKVNNREVTSGENIYMFFQKTSGKQVELLVSDKAVDGNERTVTVVPVGNEVALRHRQWIEDKPTRGEQIDRRKSWLCLFAKHRRRRVYLF